MPIRGILSRFLMIIVISLMTGGCQFASDEEENPSLPIHLEEILPVGWKPIHELATINIDGDQPSEWLLLFRYDQGLVGAVIYNAQADLSAYQNGTPLPPQIAALLVPYTLLPNPENDQAIGYIGDTDAQYKVVDSNHDGKDDTLLLLGYRHGVPTKLTMAWWDSLAKRYRVTQVVGDDTLQFDKPKYWTTEGVPLRAVATRHRRNDRSDLCTEKRYRVDFSQHRFISEYSSLTFCRGVPPEPVYPEATVLSFLLQQKEPPDESGKTVFDRLMTKNGREAWLRLFSEHAFVRRKTIRVRQVIYPGPLANTVEIHTFHADDFGPHRLVWRLVRQRPTKITETISWRIDDVRLDQGGGSQ
ncbi:MAG: hypothetical protein J7M34_06190 [Anaerolineae bacterium]|nr:hypothetical protein [Anaerolineae bacterium]